jgi:hypothetical protein
MVIHSKRPRDQIPLQQKNHSGLPLEQHRWKCRKTTSTFGAPGRGDWCFYGSDASTTPCCHPREDLAASQPKARGGCRSATVLPSPCSHAGSLPTNEFVLWQLLNHNGMSKLSQLSVSISFTLRVICLDPFSYVTQGFHTVNRACLTCSPVSIVSRNRSEVAKPR